MSYKVVRSVPVCNHTAGYIGTAYSILWDNTMTIHVSCNTMRQYYDNTCLMQYYETILWQYMSHAILWQYMSHAILWDNTMTIHVSCNTMIQDAMWTQFNVTSMFCCFHIPLIVMPVTKQKVTNLIIYYNCNFYWNKITRFNLQNNKRQMAWLTVWLVDW